MNTMEEPADGTVLIVDSGDEWTIIWRNDTEADAWEAANGDRWFDAHDEDPMGLDVYLRDAVAVYALGPKVADFKPQPSVVGEAGERSDPTKDLGGSS